VYSAPEPEPEVIAVSADVLDKVEREPLVSSTLDLTKLIIVST
jgi:hypothetical protein